MIDPDTKDWTWVLSSRCPECGFDAAGCVAPAVSGLLRANAATWGDLHERGRIKPGRAVPGQWSSLEYACHVRDVFHRFDERIASMLVEVDPLFPNWDQDATAVEDRYDEQDPGVVVADLGELAETLARRLDGITQEEWSRPGRRSDGASFTVDSIARYMIHDPIHHLWDVGGA